MIEGLYFSNPLSINMMDDYIEGIEGLTCLFICVMHGDYCVSDALSVGYRLIDMAQATRMRKALAMPGARVD